MKKSTKIIVIVSIAAILVSAFMVTWNVKGGIGMAYCSNATKGFTGERGFSPFDFRNPCWVQVGSDSHWVSWNEYLSNWLYRAQ